MDADSIRRNLDAKRAKKPCPVCDVDAGWDIPLTAADTMYLPIHSSEGGAMSLHVVPIICRNCGFVRLHDPHYLQDW